MKKNKITLFGYSVLITLIISTIVIIFGVLQGEMMYIGLGFFGLLLVQIGVWHDKNRMKDEKEGTEEDS